MSGICLTDLAQRTGLSKFQERVDAVHANIKDNNTATKVSVVVVALLAALAIGAGAALIATSGSPGALFYTGLGLVSTAVPLVMYTAFLIGSGRRHNNQVLNDLNATTIETNGILDAMLREGATREQIIAAIDFMDLQRYLQLVELALEQVDSEQKKLVLDCLARDAKFTAVEEVQQAEGEEGETTRISLSIEQRTAILDGASYEAASQAIKWMGDLRRELILHLATTEGVSESATRAALSADNFVNLAAGTQITLLGKLSPESAAAVIREVSVLPAYAQFLLFASSMVSEVVANAIATCPTALAAWVSGGVRECPDGIDGNYVVDIANRMSVEGKAEFIDHLTILREQIEGIDSFKINDVIRATLTQTFVGDVSQEANQALAAQYARSPEIVADAIFEHTFWITPGLIEAFWTQMDEDQKEVCKERLVERFLRVGSNDFARLYEVGKFMLGVTSESSELIKEVKDITLNRLAISVELQVFQSLAKTSDSKELSPDDKTRLDIALILLERMDSGKARNFIDKLDEGRRQFGILKEILLYPRYTKMLRLLIKEAADGVTEKRAALCRIFRDAGTYGKVQDKLKGFNLDAFKES